MESKYFEKLKNLNAHLLHYYYDRLPLTSIHIRIDKKV
jgi:hypothetical protein